MCDGVNGANVRGGELEAETRDVGLIPAKHAQSDEATADTPRHRLPIAMRRLSRQLTAARFSEPPGYVPDSFATTPSPRTWGGSAVTAFGVVCVLLLTSHRFMEFMAGKKNTEARVETSHGKSFPLQIRCVSAAGCDIEHVYHSNACRKSVSARAPPGFRPEVHLRSGERGIAIMCGSDHWLDGVRIAARVEAETPLARVQYKSHAPLEQWSRLPYAPLLPHGASLKEGSSSVSMAQQQTNEGGRSESWWSAAQVGTRSGTPCARSDGDGDTHSENAADPLDLIDDDIDTAEDDEAEDDWSDELSAVSGVLCYQLRLESLVTIMDVEPAYELTGLLDDWGGAYALVFGTCSLLLWGFDAYGKYRIESAAAGRHAGRPFNQLSE
mmetsp:Transcript_32981/g.77082  ORF Transcript_32981/g.77082 Transcript_32981/m.77082 type:complete len:383 (-) Transcript_32981:512-1660(-)|eukprot:CAMPEP_0119373398 /NCGR_PEP_ID=MMETSP1334-20130426/25619_1 /TAXON_ID=127549 /ORGANISM="Calcidiscus leptoporus, Strain RCC1130" /LENGTH=382 /DNA_ID=CAMNT_0007391169 /DNA_START=133 /DNA_END=1281 /DNA_ORIENTATION=-